VLRKSLKTGGKYEFLGVATDISGHVKGEDLILEALSPIYDVRTAERVPVETPLMRAWSHGGHGWYDEETDDWECRWVAPQDIPELAGYPRPRNS